MSATVSRWLSRGALVALALLGGCRFTQYPDPNIAPVGSLVEPKVMRRNLEEVHRNLEHRISLGEIDRVRKDVLIKQYCDQELKGVNLHTVPKSQAWQYADIVRQADRWQDAYDLLKVAVGAAKDEDRRVNDSLQLARCAAHLGRVDEAIKLARSTFTTPPQGKAPILFAVLYEITPESLGKGKDLEIAKLIEDSIKQHQQVQVQTDSDAGTTFLATRAHHIRRGWDEVLKIYVGAGRDDLAKAALALADSSTDQSAHL